MSLVLEDVEGWHPREPWREEELDRVPMPCGRSRPAPDAGAAERRECQRKFERLICGWRRLREERPAELDDWSARIWRSWPAGGRRAGGGGGRHAAAPGPAGGQPAADAGARVRGRLAAASRGRRLGRPALLRPERGDAGRPGRRRRCSTGIPRAAARRGAITAAVAPWPASSRYRRWSRPPPGLPTLRAFQAAQGAVARRGWRSGPGWE